MDFAALMSQAISKKSSPTDLPSKNDKKYIRRADQEREREEAYVAEQRRLQAERESKAANKRKREEEEAERNTEREEKRRRLAEESRRRREEEEEREERARRKRLGLPELPPKDAAGKESTPLADGEEDIPEDELITQLRTLKQPARLFGESHRQRLRRLLRLQSNAEPTNGLTSLELVPEADMKVPGKVPKDAEGRKYLFRQLASYFSMVLSEWQEALEKRPPSVRDTFQGKAAYNAMVQSKESMKPLFRKFESGELDVLESVVEIVKAAQEKRYVDANDGYLRLSIGKAAWPIGVTMVGIHERSAREKLHESEAHIMSDEVTRKFLQSIKRCLSFAQTRWPPEDQLQLMG
ncbi:MAG: hypothetical protein M4579_001751 [Chaenotheca gracillima]|nr:MAG: hypothetical protein M4579_001751 [Chaenotheca gracillima]